MPGILPMKVIKVGAAAQTRIAQACDRCRSKKIRCDGIRPACSQCASVGFECKTSDKLSRRAFPRGYTESLEERVRLLEAEVRDLKDLLDEKDEKIDVLSRIQSQSSQPIRLSRPPRQPSVKTSAKDVAVVKDEVCQQSDRFEVQQSPCLTNVDTSDSYFSGTSGTRTFIDAFKSYAEAKGRSTAEVNALMLLATAPLESTDIVSDSVSTTEWKAPPRLLADQLVNIYFQEWAPLFPVLHRPTFLTLYERYTAETEAITDNTEIAQLNLVFGIAALSKGSRFSHELGKFELQWKAAVGSILVDSSMTTLQILILAQLFCIQQNDLTRLLTYKGLSTALSARFGLHQSQKRFGLGTLTCETRKKVFWTLYTLDSFTAVILGLPKHLKDEDIHCEYPVDADDEYVSERGFQPSLPGEPTRLSGALALFRASRILSRVLVEVFPTKQSYELSFKNFTDLSDEIDKWYSSLAPHLRMQFALDRPSSGTTSSSSPILSLAYHYIHALIQRPAISAFLGKRSASSMIYMASNCKHIIQIVQLLEERNMSFAFCLNRPELLVLSGIGLLFQELDLDKQAHSKILRDNAEMLAAAAKALNRDSSLCASAFTKVVNAFVEYEPYSKAEESGRSRHKSEGATSAEYHDVTRKQLKAIATRLGSSITPRPATLDSSWRASIHSITLHPPGAVSQSQPSLQPLTYAASRSEPPRSPVSMFSSPSSRIAGESASLRETKASKLLNLDYLCFSDEPNTAKDISSLQAVKTESEPSDWEKLLGNLDNGPTNIFDACYGGRPIDILLDAPSLEPQSSVSADESNVVADRDLWSLCHMEDEQGHASSVFSFSTDDALSSGEDASADWTSASSATGGEPNSAVLMSGLVNNYQPNLELALQDV